MWHGRIVERSARPVSNNNRINDWLSHHGGAEGQSCSSEWGANQIFRAPAQQAINAAWRVDSYAATGFEVLNIRGNRPGLAGDADGFTSSRLQTE
ncbi:hypothetical protein SynA1544_01870 [Synechococcus sp. A15-44]|nr:hypothetical protein SynA1544_01870 [Synechococcus sp. A15-44]